MKKRPEEILNDPLLNKGTAFSEKERNQLGLHGFLPYHISTIEEQVKRRYDNFSMQPNQISKYLFLSALQNRNEVLFYRLVKEHIEEMLPFIYTPTVGDVSLLFSKLYREHRGFYISYPLRGRIADILKSVPQQEIDVIVVTDGERILGLGDLGVGGMAIPLGKLALYTLFGGIHPARTLPIFLDVGTNNADLLNDSQYLGWRHPRVRGKDYDDFVDEFIQAVRGRFPHALLQWEDFAKAHARPLLKKYQHELCSFNDDIQGTAAVVLATLYAAMESKKQSLDQQRIAVLGGGNAGMGICNQLFKAMVHDGIPEEKARESFYVIDMQGLIHDGQSHLDSEQRKFAQPQAKIAQWKVKNPAQISLFEVMHNACPTVLIGVCAQKGAFTEEAIRALAKGEKRPVILPLSNPTEKSEATPEDLLRWTEGNAIIATGSPFPPVGRRQIGQCNNVYIYPGVGLGTIAVHAQAVSDRMFLAAAKTLSRHSPLLRHPEGSLFPPLQELFNVSKEIGRAVAQAAIDEGLAQRPLPNLDTFMWQPHYQSLA